MVTYVIDRRKTWTAARVKSLRTQASEISPFVFGPQLSAVRCPRTRLIFTWDFKSRLSRQEYQNQGVFATCFVVHSREGIYPPREPSVFQRAGRFVRQARRGHLFFRQLLYKRRNPESPIVAGSATHRRLRNWRPANHEFVHENPGTMDAFCPYPRGSVYFDAHCFIKNPNY